MTVSADSFGDPLLRRAIVRYPADWRGLEVTADRILMAAGSADALEIRVR